MAPALWPWQKRGAPTTTTTTVHSKPSAMWKALPLALSFWLVLRTGGGMHYIPPSFVTASSPLRRAAIALCTYLTRKTMEGKMLCWHGAAYNKQSYTCGGAHRETKLKTDIIKAQDTANNQDCSHSALSDWKNEDVHTTHTWHLYILPPGRKDRRRDARAAERGSHRISEASHVAEVYPPHPTTDPLTICFVSCMSTIYKQKGLQITICNTHRRMRVRFGSLVEELFWGTSRNELYILPHPTDLTQILFL